MHGQKSVFPISRDPPEGGTQWHAKDEKDPWPFPISRDPPEGGTDQFIDFVLDALRGFQFLGIPPKGELHYSRSQVR